MKHTTVTVTQAAALTGYSVASIRRFCVSGRLPAERVGLRKWMICPDDLACIGVPVARRSPFQSVAAIVDAIADLGDHEAMQNDPVFAAWMLGEIRSAVTAALRPVSDWQAELRRDAHRLREHHVGTDHE